MKKIENPRESLDFRPDGYTLADEVKAYGVGLWPRDPRRWDFIRALWKLREEYINGEL